MNIIEMHRAALAYRKALLLQAIPREQFSWKCGHGDERIVQKLFGMTAFVCKDCNTTMRRHQQRIEDMIDRGPMGQLHA